LQISRVNKITNFFFNLSSPLGLPENISVLFPHQLPEVKKVIKIFFTRYYNDNDQRHFIIGINPGRFGAGVTGINFTAPKQLTESCLIPNSFKMQTELSAEFVYEVIDAFGGCEVFYKKFYLASVSPLGFVKNGVNLNYYDDVELKDAIKPFAVDNLQKQIKMLQTNRNKCICLGEKNFTFFNELNNEHHFFKEIIRLPHPRFIMQYKRKIKHEFVEKYLHSLAELLS
jgi:hypothetical protein